MKFTPEASEEQVQAVLDGLAMMPSAMDFIRRYEFGRDVGSLDVSYDLALVADFDSEEDYRRYAANPDHVKVIEERIRPILAHMARAQYVVG